MDRRDGVSPSRPSIPKRTRGSARFKLSRIDDAYLARRDSDLRCLERHAIQEPSATAQIRAAPRARKDLGGDIRGVESRDGCEASSRARRPETQITEEVKNGTETISQTLTCRHRQGVTNDCRGRLARSCLAKCKGESPLTFGVAVRLWMRRLYEVAARVADAHTGEPRDPHIQPCRTARRRAKRAASRSWTGA